MESSGTVDVSLSPLAKVSSSVEVPELKAAGLNCINSSDRSSLGLLGS